MLECLYLITYFYIMDLGTQIETARKKKGWTQFQLAKETYLSFDTVRRYEKGLAKRPSDFALRALENALGIKFEI